MLLLNAVRASKEYPLQFPKLGSYQGTGQANTTIGATIPWGPQLLNPIYQMNPSLQLKSGVQQLNLVDLNTEEAQTALRKSIADEQFRYYRLYSGLRNPFLIENIFIQQIRVLDSIFFDINRIARQNCDVPNEDTAYYCAYITDLGSRCNVDAWKCQSQLVTLTYFKKPKEGSIPESYKALVFTNRRV